MKRREIKQYEFVRKIGAGGSGVVYLANDTLLQRPVVLKLLKRGNLTTEQMRTTQLREARLASAIDHPNVCAIYDVGEAPAEDGNGEEAYIVMQYIPGKSLDKLIAEGPATLQLVLSAGIQTADGLSAAHNLGIFHRDLKPANVMLTDGGLIKILDFGLARRLRPDQAEFDPGGPVNKRKVGSPQAVPGPTYTARGGTIAYMAPEQFVTGQSSVQSDIFALGVILYELATGRHPFHRPDAPEFQSIRAIQYADPPSIREIAPNLPIELESVILRCLEKQPSARFSSAAEVRDALKTIIRTMQLDSVLLPGDNLSLRPSQGRLALDTPEEEKRTTGILSMLAERFRESGTTSSSNQNSIVVLPFINFGPADVAPLYGYALADAIATRLTRMSNLVVRPSSSLMTIPAAQLDPLSVGKKLLVNFVLAGNFLRSEKGFDLNWQLLDVISQSIRAGGSINVASFDLVSVQAEICNEVFSTLQGFGDLQPSHENHRGPSLSAASLNQDLSEEYLQARAVLSAFMTRTGSREDLQRACDLFTSVVKQDENYAPAWSGLGITHLQYARHGLGGQMHVLEARRAFDKALALDSGSVEANLYRVYMLLSRGEKESARHGIENLLQTAGNDWNVRMVAGITLRIDGMYDEALNQFNTSLRMNPANAAMIYNHRARVYQYQNQLELAADEIEKGLTLEPRQPLLRTSLGYQQMRIGDLPKAIEILENVIRDDASLRIVYPTIALCYVQLGEREKASTFIVDETLSAAEADSEMAYRLATYFAVEGDESEALHWLRRAIYLGNENYPWFSKNPAWRNLQGHADFERILEDLKKSYRRNQKNWKRLLAQVRD
jgi:serine/threonine protein kinase/tetratricopeptide (TPR) repeat protein